MGPPTPETIDSASGESRLSLSACPTSEAELEQVLEGLRPVDLETARTEISKAGAGVIQHYGSRCHAGSKTLVSPRSRLPPRATR